LEPVIGWVRPSSMELGPKPTASGLSASGQCHFSLAVRSWSEQIASAKLCMFTIELFNSLIYLEKAGISRRIQRFQPSLFRLSAVMEMQ
jgi:hypothetical protein